MQGKNAILYTLTSLVLFSAGKFSNYLPIEKVKNDVDEHIVKIYIFDERECIERIIDEEIMNTRIKDDISFRLRRDNQVYKSINEDIYLGIDLDIIKEKYEDAKEWINEKINGY